MTKSTRARKQGSSGSAAVRSLVFLPKRVGHVALLLKGVDKYDSRYGIRNVLIERDKETTRVVATDGSSLIVIEYSKLSDVEAETYPQIGVTDLDPGWTRLQVPPKMLKRAASLVGPAIPTLAHGHLAIGCTQLKGDRRSVVAVSCDEIDSFTVTRADLVDQPPYPRYENVLESPAKVGIAPRSTVHYLNPERMRAGLDIIAKCLGSGLGSKGLKIDASTRPDGPSRIYAESNLGFMEAHAQLLIMPMNSKEIEDFQKENPA